MKYYTSTTEYNCGIDLPARRRCVCLMDRQGRKLVHTKIKHPYLRWAFGEAAVIAKRDHAVIGPLAQRLEAQMNGNKFKTNTVVALKRARAVYFRPILNGEPRGVLR